uniref:Immunoglobulin domain-containing protein n=1 Tax=Pygocentrus nattereri TaxID=42514 RepID=A0A3B4CBC2_PYGNA
MHHVNTCITKVSQHYSVLPFVTQTNVFISVFLCIFFTKAAVAGSDVTLSGQVGRSVRIKCSHQFAVTNAKYFCRDPCTDQHILIKSGQPPTGKYKLKDLGKGVFTVTIADLQKSDTGTYWCGVERYMKDTYRKVLLTVTDGNEPLLNSTSHMKSESPVCGCSVGTRLRLFPGS